MVRMFHLVYKFNALFRLKHFTDVLEFNLLGKYFANVNAN